MDKGAVDYERFLGGDDEGLVEIIKDYSEGLMLYINSILRDIHLAEDAMQETYFKIAVRKARFRGRSSFKTWLYSIGRNVALDELRRRPKSMSSLSELEEFSDDGESVELEYLKEERKQHIRRAMRGIKGEHSQALWLIYIEGFSYRDAAKVMNKSVHQFESLAYRARLALKAELEKEGFADEEL